MKTLELLIIAILIIGAVQVITFQERPSGNYIKLSGGFISYEEFGFGEDVLILIHGSPGGKKSMKNLAEEIEGYGVYAIDMYGFGDSSSNVKNYGIEYQADVLAEFMNELEIDKANILGYSWGAGILINFADKYPDRLNKGILLAGMGVQEGEPTGSYYLEQIRGLASYPLVVWYPGAFAGSQGWRKGFMRSFLDSDLRPIREILPGIENQFLVLHGDSDSVVQYWVAETSNNLLQNSKIEVYSGGHGQLFSNVSEITEKIEDFLNEK